MTLSVDSWTNLTNHPIVGAAVDEHLLLLEDTLGTPHTGEFMATMIMSAAATAQRDLGCKVAAVVTDNASNMKSARTICEQNGASFITYPCLAHCLNNLVKDLMADKGRGEVLKAVTEVIVKFRNIQKLMAGLSNQGAPRPPLAADTRWGSQLSVLVYYNYWWSRMAQVAASELPPADMVRRTLENVTISRATVDLIALLDPVCKALSLSEASDTHVGMGLEIVHELDRKSVV